MKNVHSNPVVWNNVIFNLGGPKYGKVTSYTLRLVDGNYLMLGWSCTEDTSMQWAATEDEGVFSPGMNDWPAAAVADWPANSTTLYVNTNSESLNVQGQLDSWAEAGSVMTMSVDYSAKTVSWETGSTTMTKTWAEVGFENGLYGDALCTTLYPSISYAHSRADSTIEMYDIVIEVL